MSHHFDTSMTKYFIYYYYYLKKNRHIISVLMIIRSTSKGKNRIKNDR